jgi:hypothetical protein
VQDGLLYRWYKFVFATQSPYMALFAPMKEQEVYLQFAVVDGANWEALALSTWKRHHTIDFSLFLLHDELGSQDSENLQVLSGLVFLRGQVLVSDDDPLPWADFLKGLPPARATPESREQRAPTPEDGVTRELLARNPWLAGFRDRRAGAADSSAGGPSSVGKAEVDSPDGEAAVQGGLDDDAIEEVFRELQKNREQWLLEAPEPATDFRCSILGGAWTARATGHVYDYYIGKASSGPAERWCRAYGVALSGRFAMTLYGDVLAGLLSRAWCHKMQYYFNICEASGDPAYRYLPADHEGYTEPQDLTEAAIGPEAKQQARVAALRAIRPSCSSGSGSASS